MWPYFNFLDNKLRCEYFAIEHIKQAMHFVE